MEATAMKPEAIKTKAMNTQLTKTRTNTLNLKHKGYAGEHSEEAFEKLDGLIDDEKIDDEQFPYGECGWFDIMVDDQGNEYAVFGADNMLTDSVAYILPMSANKFQTWAAEIAKDWDGRYAAAATDDALTVNFDSQEVARIDYDNGRYTVTGTDKDAVEQLEYMVNR